MPPELRISDLRVSVDGMAILHGVNLAIGAGEVHALMGPNGSGKSTLANAIVGQSRYQVEEGEVILDGTDILSLPPDERARRGVFLAFQYPVAVPGVTVASLLRTALTATRGEGPVLPGDFRRLLADKMALLGIPESFAGRYVNDGFSGGEKKRLEVLQMAILGPRFAIHRGLYALSEEATAKYEGARARIAAFVGARSPREIIFVRNATEAINLVAYSWGRANVREGDLIVATLLEHHSNLVPWQLLAAERGARLAAVGVDEHSRLRLAELDDLLAQRPRLVAVTHVSNAVGTVNPIAEIVERAHRAGAIVLVDGAQSVPHRPVDVRDIGCDFLAFSGHKMLGPTGIGVLYGRRDLLQGMPPFLAGGDMIRHVDLASATWNDLPWKFEAGTPAIAEAIGLGRAVEYLEGVGMAAIERHELELTAYAMDRLRLVRGMRMFGPPPEQRGGVVSFAVSGIHPHDVASLLDREGVAVRAGHHCCQPLMSALGVPATTRASFYFYNTHADVDHLVEALGSARRVFGV